MVFLIAEFAACGFRFRISVLQHTISSLRTGCRIFHGLLVRINHFTSVPMVPFSGLGFYMGPLRRSPAQRFVVGLSFFTGGYLFRGWSVLLIYFNGFELSTSSASVACSSSAGRFTLWVALLLKIVLSTVLAEAVNSRWTIFLGHPLGHLMGLEPLHSSFEAFED